MSKITEEFLIKLFIKLYKERYTQTIWNAEHQANRENGWELKSGLLVPWFFNMRPVGSSPEPFYQICQVMGALLVKHKTDMAVGVEMAGVPLVGGVAATMFSNGNPQRFGYTRPLPGEKIRTPKEASERLAQIGSRVEQYGQKSFVEGRMYDDDSMAIFDDMSTNIGSKLIARLIVLWEAEQRGLNGVTCNRIFYFLDRGQEGANIKAGLNHEHENDLSLRPAALEVIYAISFNELFPHLEDVMTANEFAAIQAHQQDPERFGSDEKWRNELFAMAKAETH